MLPQMLESIVAGVVDHGSSFAAAPANTAAGSQREKYFGTFSSMRCRCKKLQGR